VSSSPLSPRPFGPYLLLRQIAADPLGSLWRAGTEGRRRLKPHLTIRIFEGASVDRKAILSAMESAVEVLDDVKGPSVARGAAFGAVDDLPFASIEDVPGQTFEAILRQRGAEAGLPLEQALLVAERILAALEGARPVEIVTGAPHGFLVPAFVHVSYDGEPRVWGFGLGPGLLASLREPVFHAAFAPYFAPEVLLSARPTTAGDVYSAAALLFEALIGHPPASGGALAALDGAHLAVDGRGIPDDVKRILRRGLDPDPSRREKDVPALRRDVSRLVHGGPYAASTFNLAFFVEKLFEKTILAETRQREAEERLGTEDSPAPAPRAVPTAPPATPAPPRPKDAAGTGPAPAPRAAPPEHVPARTLAHPPRRGAIGGLPPWLVGGGVALVLGLVSAGVWKLRGGAPPPPLPTPVPTAVPTAPPATPAPVVVGKEDPLFQQAVQERLQEEMKKREEQQKRDEQIAQRKRQADLDRAAEEARRARDAEESARAARDRNDRDEALRLAREAQEARRRAEEAAAAAARAAASPAVREGDLVELSKVDTEPSVVRQVRPQVSPLARARRVGGTVLLRVLVNEKGQSEEVEILRDTAPKVGLGETSRTAVRQWTWTPATKDGRKVKTWMTVQVPFVAE
jgi:TonB family protein